MFVDLGHKILATGRPQAAPEASSQASALTGAQASVQADGPAGALAGARAVAPAGAQANGIAGPPTSSQANALAGSFTCPRDETHQCPCDSCDDSCICPRPLAPDDNHADLD